MLQRFLELNRRASSRFEIRRDLELYRRYDAHVAQALAELERGSTVVDLGGGRTCSFAASLPEGHGLRLVAVDVSQEELDANDTVDEKQLADVSESLPFDPHSVDLIVSRTLLEHVDGVQAAAKNMALALKPQGTTLHLVPCRYALFALVARIVPFGIAKRLLHVLIPESKGVVEFEVFYDQCHPSGLERAFRLAGFDTVEVEYTWDQSDYFKALFPAFLVVYAYQRFAERFKIRVLASYAVVRAKM